jgi:FixJ family two-component response regulator
MDGTELAGKVREFLPRLPILLISGYSDTPVTGIPSTRFLRKPFSMSDLATEVRQTLEEFAAAG